MTHFIIFGASAFGAYIKTKLESDYDVRVDAFLDHNPNLQGTAVEGVPVVSPQDCRTQEKVIIALWMIDNYRSILPELREAGFREFYLLRGGIICRIRPDGGFEKTDFRLGRDKPVLQYLETHVVDHCNLNCRGCMHFSNMHPVEFASFSQFEKDMKRIQEVFDTVIRIRLMGGEPLLNPELYRFMETAREHFPDADIHVATNGLLLTRASKEIVETARQKNISFDITAYPPVVPHISEIEDFCKRNGLSYGVGGKLTYFRKTLSTRNDNDTDKSTALCMAASCHFLRSGKLYKCAIPAMIGDFNREFHTNLESEAAIDLYSEDFDPWKAMEILDNAIDFCAHCPDHASFQPWKQRVRGWKQNDWYAEMDTID